MPFPWRFSFLKAVDKQNANLCYFYQLLTHFISFNFSESIKKIFLRRDIKNDFDFINKINGLDLNSHINNNQIMNDIIKIFDFNIVQKEYFINLLNESQNENNINDKLFKDVKFYLLPKTTNEKDDKINKNNNYHINTKHIIKLMRNNAVGTSSYPFNPNRIVTRGLGDGHIEFNDGCNWILFNDIIINPTHYIITKTGSESFTNWLFCASLDGLNYDIISKHENIKSFSRLIFKIKNKKYYKIFIIISSQSSISKIHFDVFGHIQLFNKNEIHQSNKQKQFDDILSVFSIYTINTFIFDGNINYTKIYDTLNVNKNAITRNCIKKQLVKLFDVNVLINDPITEVYNYLHQFTKFINNNLSNKISSKFIIIPKNKKSLKDTNTKSNKKIQIKNNYFKKIIIKKQKKMNHFKILTLSVPLYESVIIIIFYIKNYNWAQFENMIIIRSYVQRDGKS